MTRRLFLALAALIAALGIAVAQTEPPAAGAADPAAADAALEDLRPGGDGERTILQLLHDGGPLMYALYVCSIIMLAFGIERGINLRRAKMLPRSTVELLRGVSSDTAGQWDAARLMRELRLEDNPIARVVRSGLRKAGRPLPEVEKAIEDAGEKEADDMRRNCRYLAIIASISPLLGLLGTVMGMIQAFMTVASREEALGRTELLAGGIYQALVTTATGLAIAIPALVLHHIYVERVDRLVSEMDDITIDLVESMFIHD